MVGACMAISGNRVDERWKVRRANPGDAARMPAVGVLIAKEAPTTGSMRWFGPVTDIYTGLTPGAMYCVDYGGAIRIGPPVVGPGGWAFRQFLGVAVAADILVLTGGLEMVKFRT